MQGWLKQNAVFIIPLLIILAIWLWYRKQPIPVGVMAPDIKAVNWQGDSVNLQDLRGNYVMLHFWGSWCAPCRKDNPRIANIVNTYRGQTSRAGEGFEIISIGLETDEERWKNAIIADDLNWPHHITDLRRMRSSVANEYGVSAIPAEFIIGPRGDILLSNPSLSDIEQLLWRVFR